MKQHISIVDSTPQYQGNVRATWTQGNQKTTNPAAVEKGMWYDNVTGYYPYGLPWASMQGQESRLYSGKELDRMHALNLYDFHARLYDPQLGRFLSPDPCSTQYEPLSPYLYCAANPILLTDPTGMLILFDPKGNFYKKVEDGTDDKAMLVPVNIGKSKSKSDIYEEQISRKDYVYLNTDLISNLELIEKISYEKGFETAFSMFTDFTVSEISKGTISTVDMDYLDEDGKDNKGIYREYLYDAHVHPLKPVWSEKYQEWQSGLAEPSKADKQNFRGTMGIVIGYPNATIHNNSSAVDSPSMIDARKDPSRPPSVSGTADIVFYRKSGSISQPIKLNRFLKAARKAINYK